MENFYKQFDGLVLLYNEKFSKVLNPHAPFEHRVQWVFYELWRHEGRRERHGASKMGPDFTHWHGMNEVAKHFYLEFLPEVIAAGPKEPAMQKRYEQKVQVLLTNPEHLWKSGLSPEEPARLREEYRARYGQ